MNHPWFLWRLHRLEGKMESWQTTGEPIPPSGGTRPSCRNALQSLVRLLGDALASEHERAGIRNQHLVQAALSQHGTAGSVRI
jgi:hypothetical protein